MRQVILGVDPRVTLVATGPLTNVAALLLAHPDLAGRLDQIAAGHHVRAQRDASGAGHARCPGPDRGAGYAAGPDLRRPADLLRRQLPAGVRFAAPPLHDPVAVARIIDPAIVTTVQANLAVELAGTHTRRATVVDLHQVTGRPPNAQVAVDLNTSRFWDLIVAAIAALS
jgi:inosine-uridine nucleoside N-ribohydrolase